MQQSAEKETRGACADDGDLSALLSHPPSTRSMAGVRRHCV
jgi:hypothetical protein